MRNFFRSLNREGVEFLLISGQAAVLYGASTFSEDFDLWIRPTAANVKRLLAALVRCGAHAHKLTPRLTVARAKAGHGFHYTVPDGAGGGVAYVDVMARPPRVGTFSSARARCQVMQTDWGAIPVVAIPDLVLLKHTRRLADYDVISNLVALSLERAAMPSRQKIAWAFETSFRVEDLQAWLARNSSWRRVARQSRRPAIVSLLRRSSGRRRSEDEVTEARMAVAGEIAKLQALDVAYWRPTIDELRQLRAAGELLEVGTPLLA
jgi:hypothetical protein